MGEGELVEIGRRQLGLVTRPQARAHLSRKTLESRLATGRMEIARRGVYRFAGVPPTRWQQLLAACLAAGPGAVASHRSAAELWSMDGVVVTEPELTVPAPMWLRLPGVTGHQTTLLPPGHHTTRHSVPVTTPARTLVDLSSSIGPHLLGGLVDAALRRRIVTLSELGDTYRYLAAPGRRSLVTMRAVLEARGSGYHPGDSEAEVDVVRTLLAAGLPPPVQQHQVVAGGTVYVLDAAYPELRIGIEYDSWDFHGTRSAFDHDRLRQNALIAAGWSLVRVTSATSAGELVATVRALRARPPVQV